MSLAACSQSEETSSANDSQSEGKITELTKALDEKDRTITDLNQQMDDLNQQVKTLTKAQKGRRDRFIVPPVFGKGTDCSEKVETSLK
jgi:hypothetical protein